MTKYTVRITNDESGINAWIDLDGQKCIMQPNLPGEEGNWATEADALAWANTHAAQLEATYEAGVAAEALKAEREAAAHAANLAAIDTAEALKALVAHLAR
jgi:hypothetical protein